MSHHGCWKCFDRLQLMFELIVPPLIESVPSKPRRDINSALPWTTLRPCRCPCKPAGSSIIFNVQSPVISRLLGSVLSWDDVMKSLGKLSVYEVEGLRIRSHTASVFMFPARPNHCRHAAAS